MGAKLMQEKLQEIGRLLDIDVSGLAIPKVKVVEFPPKDAIAGTLAYWYENNICLVSSELEKVVDKIESGSALAEALLMHELTHHVVPPTVEEVEAVSEVEGFYPGYAELRAICIRGLLAPWELRAEWVTEQLYPGHLGRMFEIGQSLPVTILSPNTGWASFEDGCVWIGCSGVFAQHVAKLPFLPEEIDALADLTIPKEWSTDNNGTVRKKGSVIFKWATEKWKDSARELCNIAKIIKEVSYK